MMNKDVQGRAGLIKDYPALLLDCTTVSEVHWNTPERGHEPITLAESLKIVPRYARSAENQKERTRKRAEVFTPIWLTVKMIDCSDAAWYEEGHTDWLQYVDRTTLEITCGEAPFLTHVYDSVSGVFIPVRDRAGILDRKLRRVSENCEPGPEWIACALRAVRSTYGYEFQGDSLILARLNVLQTVMEHARHTGTVLTPGDLETIVDAITWNLWQMDGLTGKVPGTDIDALIMDWKQDLPVTYNSLSDGIQTKKPKRKRTKE